MADKNETLVTSESFESKLKYTGKHLLKPKQKYDGKTFWWQKNGMLLLNIASYKLSQVHCMLNSLVNDGTSNLCLELAVHFFSNKYVITNTECYVNKDMSFNSTCTLFNIINAQIGC